MNKRFNPPVAQMVLPIYPSHLQLLRVTTGIVANPAGATQVPGSSVLAPILYVSFTQQVRTDTLLPVDREPCLVDDVNGTGLSPGFYLGRLTTNYNALPVYTVVAGGARGTPGAQGPPGPKGSTGDPGTQGTTGATGSTGNPGTQGTQGPIGPTGPAGPTGPMGPAGSSGSSSFSGVRVRKAAAQAVTEDVTTTLEFDTEDYKTVAAYHSNTVNNSHLIAPVTGYYHVGAWIEINSFVAIDAAYLNLAGSVYGDIARQTLGMNYSTGPFPKAPGICCGADIRLLANEYVQASMTYTDGVGGTKDVYAYAWMHLLGQ